MTGAAVIVKAVTKTFPGTEKPALNHISTQIVPGKMTGLVGSDGAGKPH